LGDRKSPKWDPETTHWIEFELDPDDPGKPDEIQLIHRGPMDDPRNVDRIMTSVGFGLTLGGYQVFCEGIKVPLFVPDEMVDFELSKVRIPFDKIADKKEDAEFMVKAARLLAPSKPPPVAWFRLRGGGGKAVIPTVFCVATAPRCIATMVEARRLFAQQVEEIFITLAISMAGGKIMKTMMGRILRAVSGKPSRPSRITTPKPPRIRPVKGKVNVGGGFEEGAANCTNLNPIVSGTGGPGKAAKIPNHVRAGFEEIGDIFEVGSVRELISNRLPFKTVKWHRAAKGSFKVMAKDGKVSLNVWTSSKAEVDALLKAFRDAGFKDVRVLFPKSAPGPGTVIAATRP
jgi:hypothetical protein